MDNLASRGKEPRPGRDGITENLPSDRQTKRILDRGWTEELLPDLAKVRSEIGANSSGSSQKLDRVEHHDLELLIDKSPGERIRPDVDHVEKTCAEGKCKKNSRKPPKPPRPPRGPSLSANDQKLVKDIAELAVRKRERIERMKTLRKMKAVKTSSSCSSIAAMIITILFFIIVIFQGFFSRSSATVGSNGSPAPSAAANDGLISVQFYNEFAPREKSDPGPAISFSQHSPSEEPPPVSGADPEEDGREIGR